MVDEPEKSTHRPKRKLARAGARKDGPRPPKYPRGEAPISVYEPVPATDPLTMSEQLEVKALRVLEEMMHSASPKVRSGAARDLLYARTRMQQPKGGDDEPPGEKPTPETEEAQMREALQNPRFRELLEKCGATLPPLEPETPL
jgi:hypothetical protein